MPFEGSFCKIDKTIAVKWKSGTNNETTIDNGDTPEVDNRDILEQEALEQIIPEETTLDFKWGRFFRRGKFVVLYLKLKVQ